MTLSKIRNLYLPWQVLSEFSVFRDLVSIYYSRKLLLQAVLEVLPFLLSSLFWSQVNSLNLNFFLRIYLNNPFHWRRIGKFITPFVCFSHGCTFLRNLKPFHLVYQVIHHEWKFTLFLDFVCILLVLKQLTIGGHKPLLIHLQ